MTQPPATIIAAAQDAQRKWRIPASISIAQWALESGWGAHSPGNNPFGIKGMAGYDTQTLTTHEFVHGHMQLCKQVFTKFDDLAQAFDCHAKLLATSSFYSPAMAMLPDITAFASKMGARYATDPLYAAKMLAVIHGSRLTQYDVADAA